MLVPYPGTELDEWVRENPDVTIIPDFDLLTHTHIGKVGVAMKHHTFPEKIK